VNPHRPQGAGSLGSNFPVKSKRRLKKRAKDIGFLRNCGKLLLFHLKCLWTDPYKNTDDPTWRVPGLAVLAFLNRDQQSRT
jgi:arabinogalactan endo-1,4-beta-galactosidase